jgi:single-strand DNA-binding protein
MPQLTVTAIGTIGTDPNYVHTAEGAHITSFRLAVTERRFDEKERTWKDTDTSWLTVTAFKQLALNVKESLHKGDRILVTGRARLRDWQDDKGRSGTTLNVVADALGHDLLWGTTEYRRRQPSAAAVDGSGAAPEPVPAGGDWGAPPSAEDDLPF